MEFGSLGFFGGFPEFEDGGLVVGEGDSVEGAGESVVLADLLPVVGDLVGEGGR